MSKTIVEVETKTFIRFWLVLLGFAAVGLFIFKSREALAIVGVSAILAIAIHPLAIKLDKLIGRQTKSKLPSVVAYLIVLLVLSAIVIAIGPLIVNEFARFVSTVPAMVASADLSKINALGDSIGVSNLSGELVSSLENLSKNILSTFGSSVVTGVGAVVGVLGKIVVIIIMTLFFLLEGPDIANELWTKLGARKSTSDATDRDTKMLTEMRLISYKMARAFSTFVDKKVVVAIIDGMVTILSISILSLIFRVETPLALPMGVITMFFCLIPMFGQGIGGAIVFLLLIFNNPVMAVIWGIFYLIYAIIESHVFEPKIQGDALNLKPVVVLIAITIGTSLLGLFGTIIAIPITGCIKILIDEYPTLRKISKGTA